MGQEHALGKAGGAGGVLDVDDVVRSGGDEGRINARVQHALPGFVAEQDNFRERKVPAAAGLFEDFEVVHAGVPLVEEERLHEGTAQDETQVVGAVGGITIYKDGADAGHGGLQVDPLDAIGAPHADAVAGADAEAPQTARGTLDGGLQVPPSQADALMPADQRVAVGAPGGRVVEHFTDGLFEDREFGSARIAEHIGQTQHCSTTGWACVFGDLGKGAAGQGCGPSAWTPRRSSATRPGAPIRISRH